jgi:hypothetical protein
MDELPCFPTVVCMPEIIEVGTPSYVFIYELEFGRAVFSWQMSYALET